MNRLQEERNQKDSERLIIILGEKIKSLDGSSLKQTGLIFIGVSLFNFFNLLFHLFMLRFLPPIDYGHFNTLMALFMIISVPASTVQTTVTKFVSSFQVQNRYDWVRELLQHLLFSMSIVAFSIFFLVALGSSFISFFLQIPSRGLIILLGTALLFAMVIPVPWGGLQGLQKFGSLTFNLIINGALKFALGIFFILLGFEVLGAMGAIAISYCVTIFLSLFMLRMSLPKVKSITPRERTFEGPNPSYVSEVYRYFLPVGMALLCFTVLTNIDLILVKHFFTPVEAGYYSVAQMVGKIILFLPIPVVMVMFPKLSSLEGQERKALSTLAQSLTIAVSLCVVGALLGLLFPPLILRILSGKLYPECIPLVRFFSINMTFFSLTYLLLHYHLSTRRKRFLYILILFTLIQIGLIGLFHKTLTQVLFVVGIVAICLFSINLLLVYFSRSSPHSVRPLKNNIDRLEHDFYIQP
jgi:O-antigen/teichoic acid export membrane protein